MSRENTIEIQQDALAVPVIKIQNLSKTFVEQKALDDVSLTILPHEVHGLLGQNGSGKSTLIKVLAGFHSPDPGAELCINGKSIKLPLQPGEFLKLGMSFVHQDLGLVPTLDVIDNFNAYDLAREAHWYLSPKQKYETTLAALRSYGLKMDPRTKIENLTQTERALLVIVRAVHELRLHNDSGRGLLILDEPTAFLPMEGKEQLFSLVKSVVRDGISVLFVSHDLDEVIELTDRVTILRDGVLTCTAETKSLSKTNLVEMITGKSIQNLVFQQREHQSQNSPVIGRINDLSGDIVEEISFEIREGEILGLTGLLGSGFDEIPYLLFGAQTALAGTLELGDEKLQVSSITPEKAMLKKIALLPADRQGASGIGSLTITDNVTILSLNKYKRHNKLNRKQMIEDTEKIGREFSIRPNSPTRQLESLSGGNQQKALLGKWLKSNPSIILLHEPTQGIDVGARQQVFNLIQKVAENGTSVICVSADYEQIAMICDRVLVFNKGSIVGQATKPDITKESIVALCYEMSK
jgi:ribose transport system ATP-binding protein